MTGTTRASRGGAPPESRWKRRGRRLWALCTAAGIAATFFSWFGIKPGTVALWGAALSAAALVVVVGAIFILATDEDRGLPALIGIAPVVIAQMVITLVGAAVAGVVSYNRLDTWRHDRVDPGLEVRGSTLGYGEGSSTAVVSPGAVLHVQVRAYGRLARDSRIRVTVPAGVTLSSPSAHRPGEPAAPVREADLVSDGWSGVSSGATLRFLDTMPQPMSCNLAIVIRLDSGDGQSARALTLLADRNGDGQPDGEDCTTGVPRGGGYGPERRTFDWNNPADRKGAAVPELNSFINTPSYGDERNFVTASRGTTFDPDASFRDPLQGVIDTKSIVVRIFVENAAYDSLGEGAGTGIARGATVRVAWDPGVASGFSILAYLKADNAPEIYDGVNVEDAQRSFSLRYRVGSARLYNQRHQDGFALSDDIVGRGTAIGVDGPDGNLPPGYQYSAYITLVFDVVPS